MLKTIDLFAGAGGLSLGFQMTGKFELVAAAEINKNARATYNYNIASRINNFEFIENVVGYNFKILNQKFNGIDIVIGGPPCQGFSNANRQKNHLISTNNALVKEFFRAIKEIKPKAFVMENVSMLRSKTHRFYESSKDYSEIQQLIDKGYKISKREDTLFISERNYDNIDFINIENTDLSYFIIPEKLFKLLNLLRKNIGNKKRLSNYLTKNSSKIIVEIRNLIDSAAIYDISIISRLNSIKSMVKRIINLNELDEKFDLMTEVSKELNNLDYIVSLQKMIKTMEEIKNNELLGKYDLSKDGDLIYRVNSYSVSDYIKGILGGEYIQADKTINAEWFGVPQERRRHIVLGIRKNICIDKEVELPKQPCNMKGVTVSDAIMDLLKYQVGYSKNYEEVPYNKNDKLSEYALMMRRDSQSVKNHITTKSTDIAIKRFKQIKQGENFHSLSDDMKETYLKPERTQNTIYLRLDQTKPSGTVVNVRKSMWIHPTLDRAVTVREAARLQSFPDNFVFIGTKDSQFQQVGNAVPPFLAKGIAEQLLNYVK